MMKTHEPVGQSLPMRWLKGFAVHWLNTFVSLTVFVLTLTLFATGVGTMILWIGFPILVATMAIAHFFSVLKKHIALWLGATPWEDLPPTPRKAGVWAWIRANLRSPERWRELAYAIVGALMDFVLSIIPLAFFGFATSEIIGPFSPYVNGLFETLSDEGVVNWGLTSATEVGIGIVALVIFFPLSWLCTLGQIGLTRLFLAPTRAGMAKRLAQVEAARTGAMQAETSSLTRIERDLHDGPQQKLLRTGIDLAALDRRLGSGDIDTAKSLVNELISRNEETLAEIRTVSRGFAPPILADHGLREALSSLVATCTVPTSLSVELAPGRLPEPVERAVYFTVAEALSNITKHAHATVASVGVRQAADAIRAVITDDGRGGATETAGHGLAGLQARAFSVGGRVTVESTPMRGTTVSVEVPLV